MARVKKANKWISVEDKLPRCAEKVLVYHMNGKIDIDMMSPIGWLRSIAFGEITHWMPLPEPPEMKEGEKT